MSAQSVYLAYYLKSRLDIALNRIHAQKLIRRRYRSSLMPMDEFNDFLAKKILSGEPFCAGRFGSNEAYTASEAIGVELGVRRRINPKMLLSIHKNAGVFPYGEDMAGQFGLFLRDCAKDMDALAVWDSIMQDYMVNVTCRQDAVLTNLSCIEPYYAPNPWSRALRGKRVLVIHPFSSSIEAQYQKREQLFSNPDILPEFELHTLRAVQSAAFTPTEYSDWFEALHAMFEQALRIPFDVAILGCGAYGFPLATMLKRAGRQAVHLGGATQLLFGIMGRRWDAHPIISKLYNDAWVKPLPEETPEQARSVEGSCYW